MFNNEDLIRNGGVFYFHHNPSWFRMRQIKSNCIAVELLSGETGEKLVNIL
jgi:hypothetical protein